MDSTPADWSPPPSTPGYQPPTTYSAAMLNAGYIDESDHDPDSRNKSEAHITGDIAALLAHGAHFWTFNHGRPLQVISITKDGRLLDEAGGFHDVWNLIGSKNSNNDALRIELPENVQLTRKTGTGTLSIADALANQSASGDGASSQPTSGTPETVAPTQQPGQPAGATTPTPTGSGATPMAPGASPNPAKTRAGAAPLPPGIIDPVTLPPPGPVKPNTISPETARHILYGERRKDGSYSGGHKAGTGFPTKSEFPASWSDEKILGEIEDVKNDRSTRRKPRVEGGFTRTGTRDGVEITVGIKPDGSLETGYPSNLPRNPDKTRPRDKKRRR